MRFRLEALGPGHQLASFHSGQPTLDVWLLEHARTATGQGTRTSVLVDRDGRVVGYFALAPHLVERSQLSAKAGRGAPRQIPALLLAKLALADDLHGQGLGAELLVAALETAVAAARQAGGKLIVVDAVDDGAAAFYRHHDFEPLPGNPRRLIRKFSSIAKAIGQPWP